MLDFGKMFIDLTGTVEIDPRKVRFMYIGADKKVKPLINGCGYIKLSDDDKQWYILESISNILDEADNVSWEEIVIEEVNL